MRAYDYLNSGKFGDVVMAEMTWNVNQPGRWRRVKTSSQLMKEQDTDWKRFLINRPQLPFEPAPASGIPPLLAVSHPAFPISGWFTRSTPFTGSRAPITRRSVVANGGIYLWRDGRRTWTP